ncbi:hypothetical protein [Kamptonema formosum]|uniref:hypothetical protein n=1 Tax=Kamptonema formosum TaxID=331992 RepID=UPI00034AA163|nr:hypothetical protein [Oscillatoria sp. PCC 10802]
MTQLPQVGLLPKEEIEAAQATITELNNYKSRHWAIGLNGDTLQPDGFLKFFSDRNLPFQFYLRNYASIGDPSAYDLNISTLQNYIQIVRDREIQACQGTINELSNYKDRYWAIGLNGDTLQPDGFVTFFGVRNLPVQFFVQSQGVSIGDYSAYDQNIGTLESYIQSL